MASKIMGFMSLIERLINRVGDTIVHIKILTAILALLSSTSVWASWSAVPGPTTGAPQVYGTYNAGCLAGADVLPPQGRGYQVMRLSRNRHYGHPQLIALVQHLGEYADARGVRLLVGDLTQARGGPMPYGHASHQNGLDVDIWFTLLTQHERLPPAAIEERSMRSVVDRARGQVITEHWHPLFTDLLRHTALIPEVERIFVNPVIKQKLCHTQGEQDWLGKLRPWWGHDGHFHVRLACPPDSPECQPQAPPPPGSGCDEDLASWIQDQRRPPPPTTTPRPRRVPELPAACEHIRTLP